MGKAYTGSIIQASTLTKNDDSPLDDRTVVQSKTDLTTSSVWIVSNTDTRYEGMLVYVDSSDTNKGLYVLSDHANRNSDSGWTKIKDSNAMRAIQVNGITILDTTSSTPLKLIAGTNITLTPQQNEQQEYTGAITITSSGGGGTTGGVASVTISTGLSLNGAGAGTIHGDESGTITLKRASIFSNANAEIGGIKVGGELSETSGAKTSDSGLEEHRYAVLIDSNDLAYVYVPTVSPNNSTITLRGGSSSSYREIDTFTTNQSTNKTIYVPVMTGATSSTDGQMGLVPTPKHGSENKYLRGDGTWQDVSAGTTNTFNTIAVSGQTSIVADTSTDTLTLVAGSGVNITTDASTDTVTFSATGGGSVGSQHMAAYSIIKNSIVTYSPMSFVTELFYPIVKESISNDTTIFIDKMRCYESGILDGHIPVGSIIIIYSCYLYSLGLISGRFIWDTPGFGDYFNYIVCNGDNQLYETENTDISDASVLNSNGIYLYTFNWDGNSLPNGINDWVSTYAARVGDYNAHIGGSASNAISHKYIFHISDIEINENKVDTITGFVDELKESPQAAYEKIKSGQIFNADRNESLFNKIVVSLEHRSVVSSEGANIFYPS